MFSTNTKTAELTQYPQEIVHRADERPSIILGDLHGNAIKLIYILIQEGLLSINETQYKILAHIYNQPPETLTTEELTQFKEILDSASIIGEASLILLGDTLADRGMNDYFTLLVYKKLIMSETILLKIIFSNHDLEFITQYEIGLDQPNQTLFKDEHANFGRSLINMQQLLTSKKLELTEIEHLIQYYYLPYLNLIDADDIQDKEGSDTVIYSHTPITPNTILELMMQFKINLAEGDSLFFTIKKINAYFVQSIHTDQLNFLLSFRQSPTLLGLLSNRYSDLTPFNPQSLTIGRQIRWKLLEKYHAINVHGHVGYEQPSDNLSPWAFTNMDTPFGIYTNGEYRVGIITSSIQASSTHPHAFWSKPLSLIKNTLSKGIKHK